MIEGVLTNALLAEIKLEALRTKVRKVITEPDLAPGFRIIARPSGQVTFSVDYRLPGIKTRPNVTLGYWPDMSIAEARDLSQVVRELGIMGVDVQLGLHTRLAEELKRDRLNWRYALSPPAPKRVTPHALPVSPAAKRLSPPTPKRRKPNKK